MCVSARTISSITRSSTDVASISSKSPLITGQNRSHSSCVTSKTHHISGLFSEEKPRRLPELPERAHIYLYDCPRRKDESPVLTFEAVTQAFAVYPERPKLISNSTLFKLEGTYGNEEMCANMKGHEGCMLLMSDSASVRGVSWDMQKWLIGEHVSFSELL
jgi:CCR4-NOT transcriptional complex subunit CAF120